MTRVGVYLGTSNDDTENVEKVLRAWGEYLSDAFEIEAFGSAALPHTCREYYNHVQLENHSFSTPFDKLLTVHRHCGEYIRKRSPHAVIQLWKFNTHATGVATAAHLSDVHAVVRYSGATFESYRSHGGFKRAGSYVLNNILNRWVGLRLANTVIVLGPTGRDAVTGRGVDESGVVIIPPPLDSENRFHPVDDREAIRRELGLPLDRKIALYVGRVTEKKGMSFLSSVVDRLDRDTAPLFIIVGEGESREQLQARFDESVLRTVGHVPYDEIDSYYKMSDIYVHPSPYEGVPLVILEALECGLPVVARSAGDIGFVTNNVVTTVREMVTMIEEQSWEDRWLNREYFEASHQRDQLIEAIRSRPS